MRLTPINPASWGVPRGFSNGMLAPEGGRLLCVAGQIGWNERQELVGNGFADQFRQALTNVVTVVREAGGEPSHVARLTIYVTDREAYSTVLQAVGEAYREVMGRHFPAMALVEVAGLLEPGAQVEIEATAVLPPVADHA